MYLLTLMFVAATVALAPILLFQLQTALCLLMRPLEDHVSAVAFFGTAALAAAFIFAATLDVVRQRLNVGMWPLVIYAVAVALLDLRAAQRMSRSEPEYEGEANSNTGLLITGSIAHVVGFLLGVAA